MSTVAFLAGPAFVLLGTYAFLRAYDEKDPRLVRLGVGALLIALVVTALGVVADRPPSTPSSSGTPSSGGA